MADTRNISVSEAISKLSTKERLLIELECESLRESYMHKGDVFVIAMAIVACEIQQTKEAVKNAK